MKIVAKNDNATNTISFYTNSYFCTAGYITIFFDEETNNIAFYDKIVYSFEPPIMDFMSKIESIITTLFFAGNADKKIVMQVMENTFGPIEIKEAE